MKYIKSFFLSIFLFSTLIAFSSEKSTLKNFIFRIFAQKDTTKQNEKNNEDGKDGEDASLSGDGKDGEDGKDSIWGGKGGKGGKGGRVI